MRHILALIATCLACAAAGAACPTGGVSAGLKATTADLLDCLLSPDPELRDATGFTALQTLMRNKSIDTSGLHGIRTRLLTSLKTPDTNGFAQPFAALVLAEVVRADRVTPYLTAAERNELARAGSAYLEGVRDYRGFDPVEGWRHGVAHGADLMLQLAVNPAITKAEHELMLAAIAAQVAPAGTHFYRYGEGERLMAPVFYLARRDTVDAAQWETWFARIAAPQPGLTTEASLARKHNLKGFLYPLYASLSESGDAAQRARLLPIVTRVLKQLD